MGTRHASYMLRNGRYKYVYHVAQKDQLFDMVQDPLERKDRIDEPGCGAVVEGFEQELRALLDPEEVDARARAAQKRRLEELGGEEALLRRGAFRNSPVPGEKPAFRPY